MQNVLTRDLLNARLTWYSGTLDNIQTHHRDDIDRCINQWKHVLVQHTGFGRGSQLFLDFEVRDINWLAVTVANWELGGKQTSFHPTYPDLWAPWHVIVSDHVDLAAEKFHALHYLSSRIDQCVQHSVIDHPPVCQPSDTVFGFNTSGSTGTPNKINHSHEFMHALCRRNISALELDQPGLDRALLVHGGAHNIIPPFAWPAIAQFEQVHGLPFVPDRMNELAQYVDDHKINVVMLPHTLAVELFLTSAPRFNHTVKIFHLVANQQSWVKLVKEKNVQSIRNSYGAVEVLSPVLSNQITQLSDDSYSPFDFGTPLDSFYSIELTDQNNLRVSHPLLEVKSHVIQDYFVQDAEGNLRYDNRDKSIRLREHDVPWAALERCVQVHGNPSLMCIIGDSESDQVCLLIDQSYSQDQIDKLVSDINVDLSRLVAGLSIDHVSSVDITEFINSYKFNLSQVRNHFRNKQSAA
jgi:hypothetical protein